MDVCFDVLARRILFRHYVSSRRTKYACLGELFTFPDRQFFAGSLEIFNQARVGIALVKTRSFDRIVFARVSVCVSECLVRRRNQEQNVESGSQDGGRRTLGRAYIPRC